MTTTARATLQHEDDRSRVMRWDFAPGESTGRHVHEFDYVVVPITDGQTHVITPDGEVTVATLRSGESYARAAGAEHEVVNGGEAPLAFVEVEIKDTGR